MGVLNEVKEVIYVGLFNGKFSVKVNEHEEGAVARINKNGIQVFEKYYGAIGGLLTNIKAREGRYGKTYVFTFSDGEDIVKVETAILHEFTTAIINRLPRLDLKKTINVVASHSARNDKTYFNVYQDDVPIEDHFQKWNNDLRSWERFNDYPEWERVELNGQQVWDYSKQLEFQKNVASQYFSELDVEDSWKGKSVAQAYQDHTNKSENSDDLPF